MISYVCKYTPTEIFAGFGQECAVLDEAPDNFGISDMAAHANLCGFGKSVIQAALSGKTDELVLVNCCDTMRRAYDVIKASGKCRFIYLLDLPHGGGCCRTKTFAESLMRLRDEYAAYSGKSFDRKAFAAAFSAPSEDIGPYVGILGVRAGGRLTKTIRECLPLQVRDLTCTGTRGVYMDAEKAGKLSDDELFSAYAASLLSQMPCLRMDDHTERRALFSDPNLRGIIYHTIKFCDFYGFEYSEIKDSVKVPLLKIETDYTRAGGEQVRTRVEAFSETLAGCGRRAPAAARRTDKKFFAGIDSGSASTDVVILDSRGRIAASMITPTGGGAHISAEKCMDEALRRAGIERSELGRVVTTGYGRESIGGGDMAVTEITCHAVGAHYLDPDVRTVIDIGGQDSKIISIDGDGAVKSFVMNDKCAAGTGRFLEMMARALGLTLEEISSMGLSWKEDVTISSMCTVFAESEVVSLVAQNKAIPDIVHGLDKSVAAKTAALFGRLNCEGGYMITGGVAKNMGVVRALEETLGIRLRVCDEAQICGALGAALTAFDM